MPTIHFVTHPDVVVDPGVPIPRWPLSPRGRHRMLGCLEQPWTKKLDKIFSSDEQKALDGAEILRDALEIPHHVLPELGEKDRSSTGFLPPDEFWERVELFYAAPRESVHGWERAVDAQARIVAAVDRCVEIAGPAESIAIVSHGCVGSLLLTHVMGVAISRDREQPAPPPDSPKGSGGGFCFAFERDPARLIHGWRRIDAGNPSTRYR